MKTEQDYSIIGPGQHMLHSRIKWANRFAWLAVEIGAGVGVLGVWVMWREKHGLTLEGLSSLGSYLQGTVASLWALGGLLLIYATFLAQRQQLDQQEAELREQNKQFEEQQRSIKLQNFESSFFQLLNLQNQIIENLKFTGAFEGTTTQRECFQTWVTMLKEQYRNRDTFMEENDLGHTREAYQVFYRSAQASVAHYFRNLYHVIKFVKSSDISDKRRYTSLVRAQLSAYELTLLFYNGLSVFGEGFKPLIEEFGLLEHLDESLLIERSHRQLYAASAYQ